MNGLICKLVGLGGCLAAVSGCVTWNNIGDTCYPERYEHMARQELYQCFAPQARNGHVLDQTIWNYHFEYDETRRSGTDRLTPAGLEKLAYLARRRPQPEAVVFLQTANDVAYDAGQPEAVAQARAELDRARIASVQKYLTALTAARPVPFEVVVHDPSMVDMNANPVRSTVVEPRGYFTSAVGTRNAGGGGSTTGGGGGGAGSGSLVPR